MMTEKTTDGLKILDSSIGNDAELREMCQQVMMNAHVAQLIYDARTLSPILAEPMYYW